MLSVGGTTSAPVTSVNGRAGPVTGLAEQATVDTLTNRVQNDESAVAALTTAVAGKNQKLTQTPPQTSAYTAGFNEIVVIDTSGGVSVPITFPSGAPIGTFVGARWATGIVGPTINAPSGESVAGQSSLTLGLAPGTSQGELVLWEKFTTTAWSVAGGFKPQSALDARNDNRYASIGSLSVLAGAIALGNVSGNIQLNLALGSVFTATITGNTVFTFTNWPTGSIAAEPTVIAIQDSTGHSVSFTGVTWLPSGAPPSFQTGAGQVNVTSFFSANNGTTVYGQGGSSTGGGFGVYGDGSDGGVVLDGTNTYPGVLGKSGNNYFLQRDLYLSSFAISSGVTLQLCAGGTAAYRLFCNGTASIASGAFLVTFTNTAASGSTGGSNLTNGSLVPGVNGPSGTTGGGVVGNNAAGQSGGFGGKGGSASGGATAAGTNGVSLMPTGASLPRALPWAANMSYLVGGTIGYFQGGASGSPGAGDGTNAGGGAGAGGNQLFLAAENLVNNGSISARGGAGGAASGGNAGGGGGGQGGPIMLIYGSYSGSGTILSQGGAGGAGSGTGTAGATGGPAWIVQLVN